MKYYKLIFSSSFGMVWRIIRSLLLKLVEDKVFRLTPFFSIFSLPQTTMVMRTVSRSWNISKRSWLQTLDSWLSTLSYNQLWLEKRTGSRLSRELRGVKKRHFTTSSYRSMMTCLLILLSSLSFSRACYLFTFDSRVPKSLGNGGLLRQQVGYEMLQAVNAKERTPKEFSDLFEASGLKLEKVWYCRAPHGVVEARLK